MSKTHEMSHETKLTLAENTGMDRTRKPYQKPQLQILGDLRTLTLGGSPTSINDSGNYNTKPLGPVHLPPGYPKPYPGNPPLPLP